MIDHRTAAVAAALLCTSSVVSAQTVRELDAHEHGAAALDVVLDGARLYLDLRMPAANVLGFEHAPATDEERGSLEAARAVLDSAEPFVPDAAAGCTLESVEVDIALADDERHGADEEHDVDGEHGEGHEEHDADGEHGEGHDEHDADGEHGDGHDEHEADDEHADGDEHESGHSDIETSHVFLCETPDRLDVVATTLFERFDGFEDIDVQLVGPGGQTALELSAERPRIPLDSVR